MIEMQLPPPSYWQEFETLCRDLWSILWGDPNAQINGRSGQKQHGVDVYGQRVGTGKWCGLQCKGKTCWPECSLKAEDLQREVAKARSFLPSLSEFCIATTARRDASIQYEARRLTSENAKSGLFSVHLSFWDDIAHELLAHPELLKRHYPEIFRFAQTDGHRESLTASVIQPEDLYQSVQALLDGGLNSRPPQSQSSVNSQYHSAAFGQEVALGGDADSEALEETNASGPIEGWANRRVNDKVQVCVIGSQYLSVLGIIAVSPIPLSSTNLKRIFPNLPLSRAIAHLRRRGVLSTRDSKLTVAPNVQRQYLSEKVDVRNSLEMWVDALKVIRGHPDTDFYLSVQLVRLDRFNEAVSVLAEAGESLDEGSWNGTYLRVLEQLDDRRVWLRLEPHQRLSFLNALGLCRAREGQASGASMAFRRLRRSARSQKNQHYVGQSFMNAGVAHFHTGDMDAARREYEQAVRHARRVKDQILLGRAACNLANTLMSDDPKRVEELLRESELAKRESRDPSGLTAVFHARGVLELERGRWKLAETWFLKAEKEAEKCSDMHGQWLIEINLGVIAYETGEYEKALRRFDEIAKHTRELDYPSILLKAETWRAMALMELGRFRRAESAFRRVAGMHADCGQEIEETIAIHATGVMRLRIKEYRKARQILAQAGRRFRRLSSHDWYYKCRSDIAQTYLDEGRYDLVMRSLRDSARAAERHGVRYVAGRLWGDLAIYLAERRGADDGVRGAYQRAMARLRGEGKFREARLNLWKHLYLVTWAAGAFDRSIHWLRQLIRYTSRPTDRGLHGRAKDQLGTCYQELGRTSEAETAHREALRIAIDSNDAVLQASVNNNLGELLRKTGRGKEAIEHFRSCEGIAEAQGDIKGAIQTAHNRSLAMIDLNRLDDAEEILRDCRRRSLREGLWSEYVRSLHGLANLSWTRCRTQTAVRRYSKALAAALEHSVDSEGMRIRLNYSNALFWQNKHDEALAVVEPIMEDVKRWPDAHEYFCHYARLMDETEDATKRKVTWGHALQSARAVNATNSIAMAAGALAEIAYDEQDYTEVERYSLEALKHELDKYCKAELYIMRFQALIGLVKHSKAQAVLDEAVDMVDGSNLIEPKIDLVRIASDANWSDSRQRRSALRGYLYARYLSAEVGEDRIVDISMHIVLQLCSLPKPRRLQQIRSLKEWATRCLRDEPVFQSDSDEGSELLLPFTIAEGIAEDGRDVNHIGPAEFEKLMSKALD